MSAKNIKEFAFVAQVWMNESVMKVLESVRSKAI